MFAIEIKFKKIVKKINNEQKMKSCILCVFMKSLDL